MEMPSALVIQDRKITHYLLIFQEKDDKSQFLAKAGYGLQNWQQLKEDILNAVIDAPIVTTVATVWGPRFTVNIQLQGPNGQQLSVVTIWQQDLEADSLRFVTLYPDKSTDRSFTSQE